MKRMLLSNIRNVKNLSYFIQKCRHDENMTHAMCPAYLRKNAILINQANALKPLRLMHVDYTESNGYYSLNKNSRCS